MFYIHLIINCQRVNMSFTLALSDKSSVLDRDLNPPIYLEDDVDYEIGLTNFDTYNTIPNIDNSNNKFVWGENDGYTAEIDEGCYELSDIIKCIVDAVNELDEGAVILISLNVNTSKVTIKMNRKINLKGSDSIGSVLGFDKRELGADVKHMSDHTVKISKVNAISIDCNIAVGSYFNGKPVHIIHQFFPTVPVGYKIVETPPTILYFPVSVKTINNITIKVVDQEGNPINFQNEAITVRLHLRESPKKKWY